jgi:hypothetical protein
MAWPSACRCKHNINWIKASLARNLMNYSSMLAVSNQIARQYGHPILSWLLGNTACRCKHNINWIKASLARNLMNYSSMLAVSNQIARQYGHPILSWLLGSTTSACSSLQYSKAATPYTASQPDLPRSAKYSPMHTPSHVSVVQCCELLKACVDVSVQGAG